MPENSNKFYLTTPIYYVNARPHIGHAYSTIAADVLARRHRLLGEDVFFLTGTDEHGQKVQRSAAAAGVPPQQFTDQVSQSFRDLWDRMGITYTDFIRTTSPRHKTGVQKLWRELQSRNAIRIDAYTGAYCVSDEAFVDAPVGTPCPDCGRLLEEVTEENFFFKLSDWQLPLLNLIESGQLHIQPEAVRNEVLSFLRGGLKDLSISRTTFDWGIPVPGNEKHVVYVWLDALANYITALGYGAEDRTDIDEAEKRRLLQQFQKFWPADIHLVGKEITRFHCVYWPAFLLALNPAVDSTVEGRKPAQVAPEVHRAWAEKWVPKSVVANGWLLFEESKMSKSRGNIVRTETILDAFGQHYRASIAAENRKRAAAIEKEPGVAPPSIPEPDQRDADLWAADVLRYFLLREIPFGQDGSFSFDALITRYNADLANGYGNLVSRTLTLANSHFPGGFTRKSSVRLSSSGLNRDLELEEEWYLGEPNQLQRAPRVDLLIADQFSATDISAAVRTISELVAHIDQHLSIHQPWRMAKSSDPRDREKLEAVLYTAAESIRIITALLYPVMPQTTGKVWAQLGLGDIEEASKRGDLKNLQWGGLKPGTRLGPLAPIFPRAPKELADIMADMESSNTAQKPAQQPNQPAAPKPPGPSPLADDFSDVGPSDPAASSHPGAPPRSAGTAATHVGGSSALTTERPGTPPHSEAPASGVFAAQQTPQSAQPASPAEATPTIAIDDFVKIDLRVAQIVVAERIPKADKLLRLEVDLGPNFTPSRRQILSGIAPWYTPEELLGRRIAVIANLAPRKMRGLDSHGMLLAASDESDPNGKPVLASFSDEIPLGSRIR